MDTAPRPGAVRPERPNDAGVRRRAAGARSIPAGRRPPRESRGPRRRETIPRRRRRPAAARPAEHRQEAERQVPARDADTVSPDPRRRHRRGGQPRRERRPRQHAPHRPVHDVSRTARARADRPRDRPPFRRDRAHRAAPAAPRRRGARDTGRRPDGRPHPRPARGLRRHPRPDPPARRVEQDAQPRRVHAERRLDPHRAAARPAVGRVSARAVRRTQGVQGSRRHRRGRPVRHPGRPQHPRVRRRAAERARVEEAPGHETQAGNRLALDRHRARDRLGRDPPVRPAEGQARGPHCYRTRAIRRAHQRDRRPEGAPLHARRHPRERRRTRAGLGTNRHPRRGGPRPRHGDARPAELHRRAEGLRRLHRHHRRRR